MAVQHLRVLYRFLISVAVGYSRVQFALTPPPFFVCSQFHSSQRLGIVGPQALQKLDDALFAQVVL